MEDYSLQINPAISNNSLSIENDSNDYLKIMNINDNDNFDYDNYDSDNLNNIFNISTPDNKEVSFDEQNNDLNPDNMDDFIQLFLEYYYKKEFDNIIIKLENKFSNFFNSKNNGLLYLLYKLKFYEFLREGKIEEAKKFYREKLFILLKEVKKGEWEIKCKFFNKLINKPIYISKQGDLQEKYSKQFTYELEKAVKNYLNEQEDSQNKELFSKNSSTSIQFDNIINTNSSYYQIIDNKNKSNESSFDLDLENRSTKEEFSDFEENILPKNYVEKEEIKIESTHTQIDQKKKFILEEDDDDENNNIINTSSKKIEINFSPKKNDSKQIDKKKNGKNGKKNRGGGDKEEIIFNQLPFLNSFKPKYIKRETLDKKIIRSFKKFITKEYNEKKFVINSKSMDENFFINLINGNLFPPIDFKNINTGEYVKFNSFNCNYLLWFFSKKGVKDIYTHFVNEKGKEFLEKLNSQYNISVEEKNQLKSYIMNYPFIFDISLINNIAQGTEISHMYRTLEKNKQIQFKKCNKEKDLKLNRDKSSSDEVKFKKLRSREFIEDEDEI